MNRKIFLLALCSLLCVSCNAKQREYEDYAQHNLDSLANFYKQEEDFYFIYFYNLTCHECGEIKNRVLSYFDSKKPIPKMYMYEMVYGSEDFYSFAAYNSYSSMYNIEQMILNHVHELDETFYYGNPAIYEIKNYCLNNYYLGVDEVNSLLDIYL